MTMRQRRKAFWCLVVFNPYHLCSIHYFMRSHQRKVKI